MTTPIFTDGDDKYTVTAPGDYVLDFLGGNDTLTVNGGTTTTATMDDGDDYVRLLSGMATVDGGAGNDRFDITADGVNVSGGADNDLFNLLGGSNQTIHGDDGSDTVNISADISNLTADLGTGDDTIVGHNHMVSGTISGGAGNDSFQDLDGANLILAGGAGDDTYRISGTSFSATIQENAGEGTDTVQSFLTYTLGANLENLTLLGTGAVNGTGNGLANVMVGNNAANTLTSLGGNDILYGNGGDDTLDGGTGSDTMYGGTGNDSYYVRDAGDLVIENAGEGTDRVNASITYTLGANLENLALIGSTNINGYGNELNNTINGNAGDNILNGYDGNDKIVGGAGNDTIDGGTGRDVMVGGTGDDVYYADNFHDAAIENPNEGTDSVFAASNYRLRANVENLTLTGTANYYGIGNDSDNLLVGNSGNNKLFGYGGNDTLNGGAGVDRMFGGLGDDIYYVDSYQDHAIEYAGEGTDSVFSTANFRLGANVENLTLTGTADIYGYGNTENNVLTGNDGNNKLFGLDGNDVLHGGGGNDLLNGGTGIDLMDGGTGNDTYYVDNVGDVVTENANEGIDTVHTSVTYTLSDNVENGYIDGSVGVGLYGNALDNTLVGNAGDDTINGNDGNDTIHGGAGMDFLYAGNGDDMVYGDTGNDTLFGEAGSDHLSGGDGNDTLYGGADNDFLDGGIGQDILIGGAGQDMLTGGADSDTFLFQAVTDSPVGAYDTVTDFQSNSGTVAGDDVLDFSGIDANSALSGDQAFTWNNDTAAANSLWYSSMTTNSDGSADMLINGDTNGDGVADFQVMVHLTTGHLFTDDIVF